MMRAALEDDSALDLLVTAPDFGLAQGGQGNRERRHARPASRRPGACGPSTTSGWTPSRSSRCSTRRTSPFTTATSTPGTTRRFERSTTGRRDDVAFPALQRWIESGHDADLLREMGYDPSVTPGTRLRDRQGELIRTSLQGARPPDQREPAPRGVDREEVLQPRHGPAGPHPGGQCRPDPRRREVRVRTRLQVLHVRNVVDPAGRDPRHRGPGPDHPDPGPHGGHDEPDDPAHPAAPARTWGASPRSRRSPRRCRRVPEVVFTPDRIREIIKMRREPVSLETPIGEEEDALLGDFIEDTRAIAPHDAATQTMLREQVEAVPRLPQRPRAPCADAALRPRGRACPHARGSRARNSASRASAFARSRRSRCASCATRPAAGSSATSSRNRSSRTTAWPWAQAVVSFRPFSALRAPAAVRAVGFGPRRRSSRMMAAAGTPRRGRDARPVPGGAVGCTRRSAQPPTPATTASARSSRNWAADRLGLTGDGNSGRRSAPHADGDGPVEDRRIR